MLAHPMNRQKILDTVCGSDSMHMTLAQLPQDMVKLKLGDFEYEGNGEGRATTQEGTVELMELFEELIDMAVSLM